MRLLGRRRPAGPPHSAAQGDDGWPVDDSEALEAPKAVGASLTENILFYAALVFVGLLAGHALMDILDHAHYLRAPREHTEVPAPNGAASKDAKSQGAGLQQQPQPHASFLDLEKMEERDRQRQQQLRAAASVVDRARRAAMEGHSQGVQQKPLGAADAPSLRRLEVVAVTLAGEREAAKLTPKFKTSHPVYESFVQQEVSQVMFRVVPSEERWGSPPSITVDGKAMEPLKADGGKEEAGETWLVSPVMELGARGKAVNFTIRLDPPGPKGPSEPWGEYSVRIFRRQDSLKQSTSDASLGILLANVPGEKKWSLVPAFDPSAHHYEVNVSEHRTHLHVMAVAVPSASASEHREQAAKKTLAAISNGAGSDTVFIVVAANDASASLSVNGLKTRVGAKLTQHRLPARDLVLGPNMLSITVQSVNEVHEELYTVVVNREPTDVGKRISAIIKARQEEVAKFLPSDRRAKVYGIVNANIRKMVGRCRNSPDPWVPLLGQLPSKPAKAATRETIKAQVDALLERAMSFKAISLEDRLAPAAATSIEDAAEDNLLKELVSRISASRPQDGEGAVGGSQEPPHQGPGAAAKKAKEGGIDAGEEAGRAGQEEEEEEDVDHRFDQVVGKEEVVEDQAEGEEEGDLGLDGEQEVDDAAAGAGGEAKGDGYDESEDASQEDELEGEEGWNEEELGAEGGHGGREGLPAEGAQEAGRGVEVKELPPSDGGGEAAGQQGEAVLIAQDHLKGGRRGEEEEAEAAEAEEEPDNKERDGQQPDRLHPFVEDVDYGADEGQEQGAAALHSDAVEGADAKGDVSQRYQDTEDNKAASQLQVPADDEGRGDEEEGIVEGVQEEAVQLQASVKDRQARTWKPKGEIREEGRGASQLQVPVGEESRNRLPRTGGKGGDAFDAERHLLAVGGGPKERYLSRQHARSRAAGGPSKERIFAESVLKPSVGGFVPNKQFSFLDNSLRPTSRRRPPPPPSASSARQAAPQGAQQQIQPSWEVAEGPQGKQKQQHGLSRPSRGHWQQQQQQQGSPSSGIPEAVPSKEMVKAFQGVAKAAGAFNSDGTSKSLKGAEKQLSACFRYLEKCEIPPETVAEGMARLAGFKKLSKTVTCPAAHVAGPSDCARLAGNPEQPAKHQGQRDQQDKKGRGPQAPVWLSPLEPGREGRARHASCAVVGNSRGLTNSDFHGAAIDAHDAVFRVNLAPTRLYEPYVGNRTTYRVLDADTLKRLQEEAWAMPPGVDLPKLGEGWVVWGYEALQPDGGGADASPLRHLYHQLQMTGLSVHLLSLEMLQWQADTYFGFMTEAVRLGLAPKVGGGTGWGFKQPSAMSTGMHAVLLAVQLCEEVNVFGFSTSHVLDSAEVQEVTPATDRYFDTPGSRRDSAGVDWDRRVFEARMLQLLHLGQHAALCTH